MEPDKSQAGDVDVGSSEGGHTTPQQHNSTTALTVTTAVTGKDEGLDIG